MQTGFLGDVLFTRTQQKVLGLLYGQPDNSFYLNEIVRLADIGKGTIKRELERMQACGLLTVVHIGNQNHYQANKACPIYAELRGIVLKTFGVADVVRAALEPFDNQIVLGFIYGSVAKGEDTKESDIDLLLVGEELAYSEIMGLLADAEERLGRPINPTIYDARQIKKKLKEKNAFLLRVMEQPKVWIKGDENGIRAFR